jgi:predicted  nucleic acid-binding Zn-ribbon protein
MEVRMAVKRTEVTNELLYETLKQIQGTLARHSDDLREIKERLGILEMQYASLSRRVDKIEERLERVERRMDLVGG